MANKPYGGKLVNRTLAESEKNRILEGINEYPKITLDKSAALDAEKIAVGAYSPVDGFFGSEDFESVLFKESLSNGLPWTIPLTLAPSPLEKDAVEKLKTGAEVALIYQGKPLAILHLEEKYTFSKKDLAKQVFGTLDETHPDVKKIQAGGDTFIAGKIDLLQPISSSDELTPKQTREEFESRKWETIAAFQTRNPPHVAHEYIQRCALELVDGLFVHPVVGELKPDDFPPQAIVETYKYLIGNYYPASRVFLSPLSIAMRYAGPKAAVLLAIVRKNYGCTHFIVGRDMAGVGNYYDPYGAQALLRRLDIGIEAMAFKESYYCSKCRSVATEKTCAHGPESHLKISGTQLRKLLASKTRPPAEIMRPEIADLLIKYSDQLQQK